MTIFLHLLTSISVDFADISNDELDTPTDLTWVRLSLF